MCTDQLEITVQSGGKSRREKRWLDFAFMQRLQRKANVEKSRVAAGPPLPCLSRNNSIEGGEPSIQAAPSPIPKRGTGPVALSVDYLPAPQGWTPGQKKQFHGLAANIEAAVEKHGIEHCGFVTLTFKDNVRDYHEVSRRFNSLATNLLNELFECWLSVKELHLGEGSHKYGLHFHLFVVTREPIKVEWGADGKYIKGTANPALKRIWATLRGRLEGFSQFGRHELLPVKSNGQAIARYVAKYLVKGTAMRYIKGEVDLKGARLLNYSKRFPKRVRGAFSWVGESPARYRRWVGHYLVNRGIECISQAKEILGAKWHWRCLLLYRKACEISEARSLLVEELLPWLEEEPGKRSTYYKRRQGNGNGESLRALLYGPKLEVTQ